MEVRHVGVTRVAILGIVGTMVGIARVAHGRVRVHKGVHDMEDKEECAGIKFLSTITTVIVVQRPWCWVLHRVLCATSVGSRGI